jgi:glucokinase
MTGWRLISDAGGTNVRFARASAGGINAIQAYHVSRFPSFATAMRAYLDQTGGAQGCTGAAIAAAGPVARGRVSFTNSDWEISESGVAGELGVPCRLINDVEAVAFSVAGISDADFTTVGTLTPDLAATHRILVANIGTGFGAATLIKADSTWVSCPSEAGHMSLAFQDWPDIAMQRQFPSVEHVLSGRGICDLYAALSKSDAAASAAGIFAHAEADPHRAATLELFTKVAGSVLGNLVLATAAWDGVFLCGSVARSLAMTEDPALFRQAFEGTGRMSAKLRCVPVALLNGENPALAGLAVLPLPASR